VFACQLFASNDGGRATSFREGEIQEKNADNPGLKNMFTLWTPGLRRKDKMPRMLPPFPIFVVIHGCDRHSSSFPAPRAETEPELGIKVTQSQKR